MATSVTRQQPFYPLLFGGAEFPECSITYSSAQSVVFASCNGAARKIPLIEKICRLYEEQRKKGDVSWFDEERGINQEILRNQLSLGDQRALPTVIKNQGAKAFLSLERLHSYDSPYLRTWLRNRPRCPKCQGPCLPSTVIKAYTLTRVIKGESCLFSWQRYAKDITSNIAEVFKECVEDFGSIQSRADAVKVIDSYIESLWAHPRIQSYAVFLTFILIRNAFERPVGQELIERWEKEVCFIGLYRSAMLYLKSDADSRSLSMIFFILLGLMAFISEDKINTLRLGLVGLERMLPESRPLWLNELFAFPGYMDQALNVGIGRMTNFSFAELYQLLSKIMASAVLPYFFTSFTLLVGCFRLSTVRALLPSSILSKVLQNASNLENRNLGGQKILSLFGAFFMNSRLYATAVATNLVVFSIFSFSPFFCSLLTYSILNESVWSTLQIDELAEHLKSYLRRSP